MTERSIAELEVEWKDLQKRPAHDPKRIDGANALAWMIGLTERERSIQLAEEARQASVATEYKKGLAEATRTLGYSHLLQGSHGVCLEAMIDAEQQFRAIDDPVGLATVLDIQFNIYHQLAAYKRALDAGLECLSLARQSGLRRQEAWALHNVGVALYEGGDAEAAEHKLKECLEIFEELNYSFGLGRTTERLGVIYEFLGDFDQALEYTERSIQLAKDHGFDLGQAGASIQYARLLNNLGRRDEAKKSLQFALDVFDELKHNPAEAGIRLQLGELAVSEGDLDTAREHYQRGLDVLEAGSAVARELKLHEAMAELCEKTGDTKDALVHLKETLRVERTVNNAENAKAVRNLKIQMETERARQQSEIHRLRYVELKNMHAQLVESEKLAVLGDLAAGLAHEANTPLGVLGSNLDLASRAVAHLQSDDEKKRARGEKAMTRALETAEKARARLHELLGSLKRFVRLDEADLVQVDVRDGLDSALTLLSSKIPETWTLTRVYADDVPDIEAHAGELNQAFMNLILHALDAGESLLTLTVRRHDEGVLVRIEYDGPEIDEEQRKSLFDIKFEARDEKMRMQVTLPAAASSFDRQGGRVRAVDGPAFEVVLSK